MWQRFAYHGGCALLFIYMTQGVAAGGRGMSAGAAGAVMALYLSSVYLLSMPADWIAKAFLGRRVAVMLGGAGVVLGNAMLALPIDALFCPGLAVIAIGTGLVQPNMARLLVDEVSRADQPMRNAAWRTNHWRFHASAFVAPLVCGYLAQSPSFRGVLSARGVDPNWCWRIGFAAASLGMFAGLIHHALGWRAGAEHDERSWPEDYRWRTERIRTVLVTILGVLGVLVVLFVAATLIRTLDASAMTVADIFGAGLALAVVAMFYVRRRTPGVHAEIFTFVVSTAITGTSATTLSGFAQDVTRRDVLGLEVQASYYQSLSGLLLLGLVPLFALLRFRLARMRHAPSELVLHVIGMVMLAASFVVVLPAQGTAARDGEASGGYLIALYVVRAGAQLLVGTGSRLAGDLWIPAAACGAYLAGRATSLSESHGYPVLFHVLIVTSLVVAVALYARERWRRRRRRDEESRPDVNIADATPPPAGAPVRGRPWLALAGLTFTGVLLVEGLRSLLLGGSWGGWSVQFVAGSGLVAVVVATSVIAMRLVTKRSAKEPEETTHPKKPPAKPQVDVKNGLRGRMPSRGASRCGCRAGCGATIRATAARGHRRACRSPSSRR